MATQTTIQAQLLEFPSCGTPLEKIEVEIHAPCEYKLPKSAVVALQKYGHRCVLVEATAKTCSDSVWLFPEGFVQFVIFLKTFVSYAPLTDRTYCIRQSVVF